MSIVEFYRRIDRRFMEFAAPWVYLLVPGIAVHELAHAWIGQRYGAVEIDWTRPRVRIDWDERVPVWGIFGFFLAPLFVGGLTAFAIATIVPIVPPTVAAWISINWLLLAGPSVVDVRELVAVLSAA